MKPVVLRMVAAGLGLALLAGGGFGIVTAMQNGAARQVLKSNDLTGIRKEALAMFPRGTRLDLVAGQLAQIGFLCVPMKTSVGDISAPTLVCASNGRGYPDFPAVNLTVSARNGLVSEIEVWNVMQRSDSGAVKSRLASDNDAGPVLSALDDPP